MRSRCSKCLMGMFFLLWMHCGDGGDLTLPSDASDPSTKKQLAVVVEDGIQLTEPIKEIPEILEKAPVEVSPDLKEKLEEWVNSDDESVPMPTFYYSTAASVGGFLEKVPIQAAALGSIQLCADFFTGDLFSSGWVWGGAGYKKGNHFFGPYVSYEWKLKKFGTYESLKWGNQGTCAEQCDDNEPWWKKISFGGSYFSELGKRSTLNVEDLIEMGVLLNKQPSCHVSAEAIVLMNALKLFPQLKVVHEFMKKFGASLKAGVQGNIGAEFCRNAKEEIIISKTSACIGVFLEVGWVGKEKTSEAP